MREAAPTSCEQPFALPGRRAIPLLLFDWSAPLLSVSALALPATGFDRLERGMSAIIHGEVTRIPDEDELRPTDGSGSKRVTVTGFLDDDLASLIRPEFYAYEIVRADGSVVRLHQR